MFEIFFILWWETKCLPVVVAFLALFSHEATSTDYFVRPTDRPTVSMNAAQMTKVRSVKSLLSLMVIEGKILFQFVYIGNL